MPRRHASPERVVIGLTGPIAAGKSTVAAMLRQRGAELIDADEVYRSLLAPGSPLSDQIVAHFGPDIRGADGHIDRGALGRIVFGDAAALRDLDRITHPAVVAEIRCRLAHSTASVVAIEAIKLAQSGLIDHIDQLWVVDALPETRLRRLMARANLDRQTAEQRLAAASDPLLATTAADVLIDASGRIEETERVVAAAWRKLGVNLASRQ